MDTDVSHWLDALENSHARLRSLVEPLDEQGLRRQSYCDEWSIAQVLSHLGSGAEIFGFFVDAGLSGGQAPSRDQFEPIWTAWNAKEPRRVADDSLASDAALIERLGSLDDAERERFHLSAFGMEIDSVMLIRMRLGEHAMHTWDIAVVDDDKATVAPDAVALLIDTLTAYVERTGKPLGERLNVAVTTSDPRREFVLSVDDTVTMAEATDGSDLPELDLSSEAYLRLVYGRLGFDHAAGVRANGVDLDTLRRVFPGS